MKSENGINSRWSLLEESSGIANIRNKFSAYGWFENDDLKISKDEHWCGWWNECFCFVSVWAKTNNGKEIANNIKTLFCDNNYDIHDGLINGGFRINYNTMTPEESHEKAKSDLEHGGRMSD